MLQNRAKTSLVTLLVIGGICTSATQALSQVQEDYRSRFLSRTEARAKAVPQTEKSEGPKALSMLWVSRIGTAELRTVIQKKSPSCNILPGSATKSSSSW